MKIIKNSLVLFSSIVFITSCATNKVGTKVEQNHINTMTESSSEPTEEELFIKSLDNVCIEFVQSPKPVNCGKKFSCSYKVFVSDSSKNPLADYSVTFSFPSGKKESLEYSNVVIHTNDEGFAELTLSPLSFGVKDYVSVYPTPAYENTDVVNACLLKQIKSPVKVRSDIMTKGVLLFVWDFNEKNKPVNNSYEVLSELRNYGISMAGNAPVNDSSKIGESIAQLYKENYEIVEDSYGYLICGTVKFIEPVTKVDDSYKCSLIAEIKTVNMKSGKVQIDKTYTHEAFGANWNKAVSKCKEELAAIVCEDVIYGL